MQNVSSHRLGSFENLSPDFKDLGEEFFLQDTVVQGEVDLITSGQPVVARWVRNQSGTTLQPGRVVKEQATSHHVELAGVGDSAVGIVDPRVPQGIPNGAKFLIIRKGPIEVYTSGTVSDGDTCDISANGEVSGSTASTDSSFGVFLEGGTGGALVRADVDFGAGGGASSGGSGYEYSGGFADRTTGQTGASAVGSNVQYTTEMSSNGRWYRFGFDAARQIANDVAYWSDPAPAPTEGVGLFGGSYMPTGVSSLYDFSFNSSGYSDAVESGDLQYTAADGSLDFTECKAGDLAIVRFDFNVLPQVANSTLEVGLIWQTRDANDNATFTFALAGQPIFFGTGSVGQTFLNRPLLTAYFASNEDVNARALPAIRCDNQIQIQPLAILTTIVR